MTEWQVGDNPLLSIPETGQNDFNYRLEVVM
jgi:hypothetical protein